MADIRVCDNVLDYFDKTLELVKKYKVGIYGKEYLHLNNP